jgi:Xaa-Pro dipeptidase
VAAVGDSPALAGVFAPERINPPPGEPAAHRPHPQDTYEAACIRTAAQAAARAHAAAEQAFRAGESEFAIHLRYLAACGHTDTQLPYNNIVALNEHGAVLHYQGRERNAPAPLRSFLIDAGAVCHAYACDITRTYAYAAGEFADLVAAMDRVQLGLVAGVRAGVDYKALHLQAHRDIAGVLAQAGVIRVAADAAVDSGLSSVFFPHGLALPGPADARRGRLVDDAGALIARPQGHPALRLTRVLEAGNVLTVEPGLYFIDSLLSRWRRAGCVDDRLAAGRRAGAAAVSASRTTCWSRRAVAKTSPRPAFAES